MRELPHLRTTVLDLLRPSTEPAAPHWDQLTIATRHRSQTISPSSARAELQLPPQPDPGRQAGTSVPTHGDGDVTGSLSRCRLPGTAHSQRKRTYQMVSFFSCGPKRGLAWARMAMSQLQRDTTCAQRPSQDDGPGREAGRGPGAAPGTLGEAGQQRAEAREGHRARPAVLTRGSSTRRW